MKVELFSYVMLYCVVSSIAAFQAAPAEAQGTPNFIPKFDASGMPTANSIMFDNGNVGIGTTGPNTKLTVWTPNAPGVQQGIRINAPFGFAGNGNGSSLVFSQDRSPSEDNINAFIQGVQEGAETSERAYLAFGTRSGAGAASVVSEKMRITSAGNVGIGTTSPREEFDVHGSARFGSAPDKGLRVTETGGVTYLQAGNGANGTEPLVVAPWYSTYAYLYISGNGNIGISNANPVQKLDIAGTVRSSSGGFMFPDGTIQTTATLRGPAGPQGPAGPPGPPTKSVAVCSATGGALGCACSHQTVSRVVGGCTVTSDTGSCANTVQSGCCAVCAL